MTIKACVSVGLYTIHVLFIHAKTQTSFKTKVHFISKSYLVVKDNLFLNFPISDFNLISLLSLPFITPTAHLIWPN